MDVTLTATVGRTTGSRPSNRLRAEGKVPGVLYGLGKDTITLDVDHRSLRQALTTDASLNAVITLEVDGNSELCIVRELQRPVDRAACYVPSALAPLRCPVPRPLRSLRSLPLP